MNAAAEAFNRRVGAVAEQSSLNVRRLQLVEQRDDQATVDLDAFAVIHARNVFGSVTFDFRFGGPVALTRRNGEWRVESLVIDRLRHPDVAYTTQPPSSEVQALLTPRGSAVVVDVVATDSPILIDEVAVEFDAWRLLRGRFGSTQVPIRLEPGERFTDYLFFAGISTRTPLEVVLTTDRGSSRVSLAPPRLRTPLRRRLMPVWSLEGLMYLAVLLGLVNWTLTGGAGFAGIGLGFVGAIAVARSARLLLASFPSPWAVFLGLIGTIECAAGVMLMLRSGLGWLGALGAVGTVAFATQRSLQAAHAAGSARRRLRRGLARSELD